MTKAPLSGILSGMEPQKHTQGQEMSQSVDVSGLSPEAVHVVEKLIALLRSRGLPDKANGGQDPWAAAVEAIKGLTDYDFQAWSEQRAFDRQHGQDHLK